MSKFQQWLDEVAPPAGHAIARMAWNAALAAAEKLCREKGDDYGPHEMSGHCDGAMEHACRVCADDIAALRAAPVEPQEPVK